ncbi:MAG: SMC-Scp complex subunit ScpB [Candidatus Omnitrophica bacterium]|nr:SMC-Scp complex subunit ScpB [Candidatus Omnitrophota bacterium]MCA9442507.1 SMC-Scp complex subunit ScpB [Candidatus Omnitrophota bacterium]MCA9448953.1 SMC-Scp complex subunit ScpB [Candidatus Omnitrophota bacterium]MCB9766993.1 SMC-Scp complex subunit ScpB [Candidatus Omnitrophota bacterium]MCB9784771.1 SMC-Scp complex subunit ScpB [Candidatus Omnitrophota bacterium]
MSLGPILEALFFATDEPLTVKRIAEVLPEKSPDEIGEALDEWRRSLEEDESRGLQVVEVAGGLLLATKHDLAEQVDKLLERRKKRTLSQAALETLAIIAYRQPITRAEIEAIRGVNVDSMVHTLLQRRLIKISGRKDVPGQPFMYRVTKQFLNHFGLRDLGELPKIDEISQALAEAEGEEDDEESASIPVSPEEAEAEIAKGAETEEETED